jgi:hypothetical protein
LAEERKGLIERLKTRKTIIMRESLLARLEKKLHGETLGSPQVTRLAVDKTLESKRETKKREWLTKGYSPFLVEKGLLLADEWVASLAETWAPGMPEIQKVIVEKNYDRALDVADRWLKAMMA